MQFRGFTLIELLITIVIGVILLTVGVPSMQQFLISSAVTHESNNLFNAFHSARSQAIALNQDIVLCYANTTNTCTTTSLDHLLIFADKDKNGVLDTANADPDVVLLVGGTVSNRITITLPQATYRFTQEGMLRSNGSTITLYNKDSSCTARKLIVSLSGSAQMCDYSKAGTLGCPTGSYCP
ncbi:MAG: prepilin-type N-terminal cleavage/methylation domain-containing protein [Tolumonas sp.]|nr:MAG: prepilin-type N-terminal cleavage/methylation domain-containing protein [Tolumonas sp.]